MTTLSSHQRVRILKVASVVALGIIINDRLTATDHAIVFATAVLTAHCDTIVCSRRQCTMFSGQLYFPRYCAVHQLGLISVQRRIVKDWTRSCEDARDYVTVICLLSPTCLIMLTSGVARNLSRGEQIGGSLGDGIPPAGSRGGAQVEVCPQELTSLPLKCY